MRVRSSKIQVGYRWTIKRNKNSTKCANVTNTITEADAFLNVFYYELFFTLTLIDIRANILVVTTVLRHAQLLQPANFFLVSLAFSDLLMECLYLVLTGAYIVDIALNKPIKETSSTPLGSFCLTVIFFIEFFVVFNQWISKLCFYPYDVKRIRLDIVSIIERFTLQTSFNVCGLLPIM